jgi:ADP-ribose pyrophosphatase YjhB (NUDIX family)
MAKKWEKHTPKGKKLPKYAADTTVESFVAPVTESARQLSAILPHDAPTELSDKVEHLLAAREELKRQKKEKGHNLTSRLLANAALGAGVAGLTGLGKGFLGSKLLPDSISTTGTALTMAGIGAAGGAGLTLARHLLRKKLKDRASKDIEEADPVVKYVASHPKTYQAAKEHESASYAPWRGLELGALLGGAAGLTSGSLSGGSVPVQTLVGSGLGAAAGAGLGYLYSKYKKKKLLDNIELSLSSVPSPKAQEAVIEAEVENTPELLKAAESVDDLAANLRQQYQTYRSRPYALDMYGHNPYATGHYSEGAKTQYTFDPYDANLGLTAGASVPLAPARQAQPTPERVMAVEKAGLADLYPAQSLKTLPLPQLQRHVEAVNADKDRVVQERDARIQSVQAEADQLQNKSQQAVQRNKDLIAKWKARDTAKQEQMAKMGPTTPAAPVKPASQGNIRLDMSSKPVVGMEKLSAALEAFIKKAIDGRGPIVASNGPKMRGMGGPPQRWSAVRGGVVIDETHRPTKLAEVEEFELELKKIAQLNKKVKIAESKKLRERSEVIVDNGTGVLAIKKDGYLLLPGGGINEGESAEEAVKRETVEEADMHIKGVKFVSTIDSLFNPEKPIMPEYDGESSNFFTAKAGEKANENHEDNEDFKFIPYAEAIEFLVECMKKPENEWALQNNAQRLLLISELDKPKNVELVKEADVATFIPKKETLAFTPNGKLLIKALGDRRIELPGEVEGATPVPYEQAVKFVPDQGIPEPGAHGYEYHLQQADVPAMEGYEEMDPDEVLKNLYASLGKPQNKQYQALDRSRARAILRILKKRKPNLPLPTI